MWNIWNEGPLNFFFNNHWWTKGWEPCFFIVFVILLMERNTFIIKHCIWCCVILMWQSSKCTHTALLMTALADCWPNPTLTIYSIPTLGHKCVAQPHKRLSGLCILACWRPYKTPMNGKSIHLSVPPVNDPSHDLFSLWRSNTYAGLTTVFIKLYFNISLQFYDRDTWNKPNESAHHTGAIWTWVTEQNTTQHSQCLLGNVGIWEHRGL